MEDRYLELVTYAQNLKDENEHLRRELDKLDNAAFRGAQKSELRAIIYEALRREHKS